MKTKLNILFLGLILAACNKDLKLYKEEQLSGKISLEDRLTGVSGAIASEAIVYLSKDNAFKSTNDRYLYNAKADKEGVFTLPYLPDKLGNTRLTAKYTNSTGLLYRQDHNLDSLLKALNGASLEIKLNPVYTKGILTATWTEGQGADVRPVVGAEVYLFKNANQAGTISNATPDGFVQKTATNANGIALFYGLDKGIYYVAARSKPGGVIATVATSPVEFTAAEVDGDPQIVKKVNLINPVIDELPAIDVAIAVTGPPSEPLARFHVYVFTSKEQAETISDKVVSGYIRKDSTDATGFVRIKNLPKQKYYVGVQGFFVGGAMKHLYLPVDMTIAPPPYKAPFLF